MGAFLWSSIQPAGAALALCLWRCGGIGAVGSISDISAQLSYMFSEDRYRITVYGKNLTDEREIIQSTIGGIATRGYWNDPRTVGVELSAKF